MLYEYWCYLRIHQTFSDLDFDTTDVPGTNIMQESVFDRNDLRVILFHDVHPEKCFRGMGDLYPKPIGTPDFAVVFKNLRTRNTALLILDAKADAFVRGHMIKPRNKYLRSTLVKGKKSVRGKLSSPLMIQSWIVLSGDDEQDKPFIECPPSDRKSRNESEFDELDEESKNVIRQLRWNASNKCFNFQQSDESPDEFLGVGYLRSRIRCRGDRAETDQFKTFLTAEIKLMDQLLAKQEESDETE